MSFSGGKDGHYTLATTELWDGENWRPHVSLPKKLQGHCLARINSTHYFITGGADIHARDFDKGDFTFSVFSYIYNGKEFIQVANMSRPRMDPGCGLHDDHLLFVAGGYSFEGPQDSLSTSEYFSLKTLTWSEGPSLESNVQTGRIISTNNRTFLIGNKNIYELTKTGEDSWQWKKVKELDESNGFHFDAFLISSDDCRKNNAN